jgi:ATP-dependent Clp protease ATP-binding subunit ClpA
MQFTDGMRRVLDRAAHEARALNHHYIGTEHLLLGLAEADSARLDATASTPTRPTATCTT